MSYELSEAISHLVAILRREFSARGNPPELPSWLFPLPRGFKDCDDWRDRRQDGPRYGAFADLISDTPRAGMREAVDSIPPLRDVQEALSNVCSLVAKSDPQIDRLRYLFLRFCRKSWLRSWTVSTSSSTILRNDATVEPLDAEEMEVGYEFDLVSESGLIDLLDAAAELRSSSSSTTDFTARELNVLEALGDLEQTAEEISIASGYPYNSSLRALLSTMKKRGILKSGKGGRGYRRS